MQTDRQKDGFCLSPPFGLSNSITLVSAFFPRPFSLISQGWTFAASEKKEKKKKKRGT